MIHTLWECNKRIKDRNGITMIYIENNLLLCYEYFNPFQYHEIAEFVKK